jgi:hypothetical protein
LNTFDKDQQLMEEELDNYRKQIEKFQQQSSDLSSRQSNENVDEIISQRIDYLLHRDDEQEQHTSKDLTDIPTLLHSVGITNYANEDFSNSLYFNYSK